MKCLVRGGDVVGGLVLSIVGLLKRGAGRAEGELTIGALTVSGLAFCSTAGAGIAGGNSLVPLGFGPEANRSE